MRPARCAAGACDHNCSGKCFYLVRPSHPVQLMVGAPLGPSENELLHAVKRLVEAELPSEAEAARSDICEIWERIPQAYKDERGL